jgi:MFS family permease
MLADLFRPKRIPLVFALLQLGFILGLTLGTWGGGQLIALTAHWPRTSQVMGLTIFNWQWILILVGVPGLITAILFLFVREPPRRTMPDVEPLVPENASLGRKLVAFTGLDALRAINMRGRVFYPLFAALALAAVESLGINAWRVPFILRTYGWSEVQIGNVLAPMLLVGMLLGITLGGLFVTWLGKRHMDANIRAATILFGGTTIMAIAAPLMPTAELALTCMAAGVMFGLAGAVPQNAAIQRIAPNEMRGQVTAVYLFMFTFFGAVGSYVIGFVGQYVVGDPQRIWLALLITAIAFLPAATLFMYLGIRPYREEVERLEAVGL